jgi:PAS domain S-box-containing protein
MAESFSRPIQSAAEDGAPRGRRRARLAGGLAGVAGLLVLLGWAADWQLLRRLVPGAVSMNPLTALCFILAGLALIGRNGSKEELCRRCATAVALLVMAVGLSRLLAYVLGLAFAPDQWLFHSRLAEDLPGVANQIAPNTALNFVLLGAALLLPVQCGRFLRCVRELALLAVLLSALLAVIGYTYRVHWLYGVDVFIPMALPTALLFALLAAGTLGERPEQGGLAALLASRGPGGLLLRRLLPAFVLVFFALGWLRLAGERRGLYDADMGTTLYTFFSILLLGGLIWWSARSLHLADLRRARMEADLERFFELSLDLLGIADMHGYWKRVNPAFTDLLGHDRETFLATPFLDLVHPDDRAATLAEVEKLGRGEPTLHFTNRYRHRDGSWRWIAWKCSPFPAEGLLYASGRDVTRAKAAAEETKRMNEELLKKTVQLEAANKELESFSYSVSHDLRAPLRGIAGFALALEDHAAGVLDDTARSHLQRVRSAADRMSDLIDDLLKLSRLTRAEMRQETVDLSTLAEAVFDVLREREPERRVGTRVTPGLVACGDPALLRILLENLLGNAWKFTSRNAAAEIEVGQEIAEDGAPVFYVRDNGVGFDMRYVHKLFSPFQRLHAQADFPGTGIGLAIVQRVVARHGGRVWAEARPSGGACFRFQL